MISGLYLALLAWMAWVVYLSWENVNSNICMERYGVGISGHVCFVAALCIYMTSRCNLARHAHFEVLHVQCSIHDGMVLS